MNGRVIGWVDNEERGNKRIRVYSLYRVGEKNRNYDLIEYENY